MFRNRVPTFVREHSIEKLADIATIKVTKESVISKYIRKYLEQRKKKQPSGK